LGGRGNKKQKEQIKRTWGVVKEKKPEGNITQKIISNCNRSGPKGKGPQ